MTDLYQKRLQATLTAVWGANGFTTWVEPIPPSLGGLSPQHTDLLLAGMKLLNWDFARLNLFLEENFAIPKIGDLKTTQVDPLFEVLNEAISNWQINKLDGYCEGASLSSLSCRYWQARLALYPQSVPAIKRRKKWLIDGYSPPEYEARIPPNPDPNPEPKPDPEPEPPDDWRYWDFPDEKYWERFTTMTSEDMNI